MHKAIFCSVLLLMMTGGMPASADSPPEPKTFDCIINPSEIVDVGSAATGVLEAILVDRGDPVTQGMVLARLDSELEQATVKLAQVKAGLTTGLQLRRANASYLLRKQERNQKLFHKAVISQNDMDLAETEARLAQLQVRKEQDNRLLARLELTRAKAALKRRIIHSPISGVVTERYKSPGEFVDDSPILQLAQLDPLHVEVLLPVDLIGQIQPGMTARVFPAAPGQPAQTATVIGVDQVADAASGTFGVRLQLANPDHRIPAGLRCQMAFTDWHAPAPAKPDDSRETPNPPRITANQPAVPPLSRQTLQRSLPARENENST